LFITVHSDLLPGAFAALSVGRSSAMGTLRMITNYTNSPFLLFPFSLLLLFPSEYLYLSVVTSTRGYP